jgi:hypothetical protein
MTSRMNDYLRNLDTEGLVQLQCRRAAKVQSTVIASWTNLAHVSVVVIHLGGSHSELTCLSQDFPNSHREAPFNSIWLSFVLARNTASV